MFQMKGVDDSDVSPGFVLCSHSNPIKTGRVFDAQVFGRYLGKMNRILLNLFCKLRKYLDCDAGPEVDCVRRLRLHHASSGDGRGGGKMVRWWKHFCILCNVLGHDQSSHLPGG